MIIDAHSHPGEYKEYFTDELLDAFIAGGFGKAPLWWQPERTWTKEDFYNAPPQLEIMDRLGIDKSIVLGQTSLTFKVRSSMEFLARVVERCPQRLIGVHSVDPVGGDRAAREVEDAVKQFGFKGIKLYPVYNEVTPDDPRAFPIYEVAQTLGIPVTVHMGFTSSVLNAERYAPLEFQHPFHLDKIPAAFPNLKLIVAHFANPWGQEVMMLMRKYRNLYADLAYEYFPIDLKARDLVWAKFFGLLDRLMWGSDYPVEDPGQALADMRRLPRVAERLGLEPALTDADIELVLGANAARIFALDT